MAVTLQRWGNSVAVRLPRPLLDQLGLGEGAQVEIRVDGDRLVIARTPRRPTLDTLLAGMTAEDRPEALDWGPPVGKENW
jgi:antitoxin MazE